MDIAVLQRMLERERSARKEAERLLEEKAEALYNANLRMLKQNASLESDIDKRTAELQKAIRETNLAKEAENEFLSKMSHEIRTPMNAIIGMTHLMFDTVMSTEQREYIDSIHYSANLLKGLISDVLDLSKIESGTLNFHARNMNIREILKAIQQTFVFTLKGKPVQVLLSVDERLPQVLSGDDVILNQILMNLVGNASKFTEQGFIEITATKIKELEHGAILVEIGVRDSGIGIPADKLASIFDKFSQAASDVSFKYGGTGLGLAITKQLVELYEGTIDVSSTPNEGTNFRVRLPFHIASNESTSSKENKTLQETPLHAGKLLVVEDNPLNQKYLGKLLDKWGLEFDIANNGLESVELARQRSYDLILMDIQMPEMNGHKATIHIRNIEKYRDTPIIGLSAFAFEQDVQKSIESGMNDHLSKPFSPTQLRDKLVTHLSKMTEVDQTSLTEFVFNPKLDLQELGSFYEGDVQYAVDMFVIFLKNISGYTNQLSAHIQMEDWEGLCSVLHKIKPTFPMVGLSEQHAIVCALESEAKNKNVNIQVYQVKLDDFIHSVDEMIPVLENEVQRMNEFIENR